MILNAGSDGSEPLRPEPIGRLADSQEERRVRRAWRLGTGTLACPLCDAPVALAAAVVSPADPLGCPFCDHRAAVRDFLSLAAPSRPTRVEVRIVHRGRRALR